MIGSVDDVASRLANVVHVGDAVAPDVVDAQVEQVRAVAGLVLGDVEALLPVLGDHRLAESLGAVGIRPLADHQHRRVLVERNRGVQRRHRGLVGDMSLGALCVVGWPRRPCGCARAWCRSNRRPATGRSRRRSPTAPRRVRPAASGYSAPLAPSTGRPAFGITDTGICACWTGSAGVRSSRRARSRSSGRSCRHRAVRPPSAPRRSRCRAAWCRWSRR